MKILEFVRKPDWNDPKNYDLPVHIEIALDEMSDEDKSFNSIWISHLLATYPRKKCPPILIN